MVLQIKFNQIMSHILLWNMEHNNLTAYHSIPNTENTFERNSSKLFNLHGYL